MHDLLARLHCQAPLIHCITNPISINQCANALLAVGARPIMAEHPLEVGQIAETAQALMLNTGNITDARMVSIRSAAATAQKNHIPFLLDAVGVACSDLRRNYVCQLLESGVPTVLKGNYSEILALYHAHYRSSGVDADHTLTLRQAEAAAVVLARRYGTTILASGKTDIITDGRRLVRLRNGTPQLATVTGTGCMLGALCAAFLAAASGMDAAVTACAVLGICGQLAETQQGSGSFMVNLLDHLSTVTDSTIAKRINTEEANIEEF